MAQIMDARPLASAGVRDLASQQELPEYRIHRSKTQRAAGGRREEVRIGWTIPYAIGVLLKALY